MNEKEASAFLEERGWRFYGYHPQHQYPWYVHAFRNRGHLTPKEEALDIEFSRPRHTHPEED